MRISSQLLTNELVLRFLSEPPQFSTNPPTVALLPYSEWWAIACKCWGDSAEISTYIHWCIIDNLWREARSALTMPMSGLSLWDCDRHGELFRKFFHNLLTFFCWGPESWPSSSDQESWGCGLQKYKYVGRGDIICMLLPHGGTLSSLHIVTLNILKFCQGHPPSTRTHYGKPGRLYPHVL